MAPSTVAWHTGMPMEEGREHACTLWRTLLSWLLEAIMSRPHYQPECRPSWQEAPRRDSSELQAV